MAIADNLGYVKQTMAGFLGLLMAQSAASAESKFLSLVHLTWLFRGSQLCHHGFHHKERQPWINHSITRQPSLAISAG